MKVLRFHTGRGGRYHNAGHVLFRDFGPLDTLHFTDFFEDETHGYIEEDGTPLDYEHNEDGTGYINVDGEYNRDDWVLETDLSPAQCRALARIGNPDNNYYHSGEARRIIVEYYPEYIEWDECWNTII